MERKEFKNHLKHLTWIPILLLVAVAGALSAQIFRQRQVALTVNRADQMISRTTRVMKLLVDMETGFRGYLLGREPQFLEPYDRALASIQAELGTLKNTARYPEVILPKLDYLETSIGEWSSYARTWISRRGADPRFGANFSDAEGKKRMDAMRTQIQDVLTLLEKEREETTSDYDRQFKTTLAALFLLLTLAAAAIVSLWRREARWLVARFGRSLEDARKENEHFRVLFNGVKDYGIALLDPQGKILRWNPGAETLTGYLASEVTGQSVAVVHPQDELSQQQLQSLLQRAEEVGMQEQEMWRPRKNGSKFWADVVVTALRETDGHLRGYTSIFRDYSKRKQIEQERSFLIQKLEEGIRGRDDFLILASHELKTPMTSISLQLQSIKKQANLHGPDPDRYSVKRRLVDTFERQVIRMNKLIEAMLDMAKIHSGMMPMKFSPTPLSELVQGVVDDFGSQFEEAGCPLSVHIEPGVTIHCDALRIEQVVVNVVVNALRYACVGKIEVILKKVGETAVLSVRDEGPGIPQEHQARIFERYGRIEGIHDQGGLGLGLYLSKEFIEAHNGRITLQSEPGKGSTFLIELPIEQD